MAHMTDYTGDAAERGISSDAAIGQRYGRTAHARHPQKRTALNVSGLRRSPGHL